MSSIIRYALALSAVAAVAVAQDSSAPKLDAPCADAVIFMARGNNAPYHDSRTFPFVDATCGKLRAEGKSYTYELNVRQTLTWHVNPQALTLVPKTMAAQPHGRFRWVLVSFGQHS